MKQEDRFSITEDIKRSVLRKLIYLTFCVNEKCLILVKFVQIFMLQSVSGWISLFKDSKIDERDECDWSNGAA